MNTSVTKTLRQVLLDLFAFKGKQVYSDTRKEGVGVKFVGLKLTEDERDRVRREMEARGFTHHYIRENAQGWGSNGLRFCFSPPKVEIVKKPKQELKTEQSVVSLGIENKNKVMNKGKIQPISMKCSREQFEEVKPILEQYGLKIVQIDYNESDYDYLLNNLAGKLGDVSNYCRSTGSGRTVYDQWDMNIFLHYCGIETKTTKTMATPKMYEVHLTDIMKIHDIACSTWKQIITEQYISKVDYSLLTYPFLQSDVDAMFQAATPSQVPVLEEVFGKQVKEIEWGKIKTGSRVKIINTGDHCSGWQGSMDSELEVDVVFFGTEHLINGSSVFSASDCLRYYFTFHKDGKYILFGSNRLENYKNFITEVIEY